MSRSKLKYKIKLEEFSESQNSLMIESIHNSTAIWDSTRQKIPGIKTVQLRQYTEIANTLHCSVDLLKKKWNNLKRGFFRQVKKIPLSVDQKYLSHPNTLITDWPYYRRMLFLIDRNDIHPSVLQGEKSKKRSKIIKIEKEAKKRRTEESDTSSSSVVLQLTESSGQDLKKRRIEESDDSSSSDAETVNLRNEETAVDLSSQVSSTSNRNYLSTGVLDNDMSEPVSSNYENAIPNQNDAHQVEITPEPENAPVVHPVVFHTMLGLFHYIHPMEYTQKVQICNFIQGFIENIKNNIENEDGE